MQVNVNIDTALDLKMHMHGVIMKKCEFVAEEQGAQEREIKFINKKAKKS